MDAMDEFQEADILWPDTARAAPPRDELLPFAPSAPYEAAGSVSSGALVFGGHFEGSFVLSGAGPSSSAGASPDVDDDEEWQEADVLWPDTVDEPLGGGGLLWPFPGGLGRAGRHVKPAAAAQREGWRTGPAVSSPIDIPANVAARHRLGAEANRCRVLW